MRCGRVQTLNPRASLAVLGLFCTGVVGLFVMCSCRSVRARTLNPRASLAVLLLFYAGVVGWVVFVSRCSRANIESPRFFGLRRSPTGRACLAYGSVSKGGGLIVAPSA